MSKNLFFKLKFTFSMLTLICLGFFLFLDEKNRTDTFVIILYGIMVIGSIVFVGVFIRDRNKHIGNISKDYLSEAFHYFKRYNLVDVVFYPIEIIICVVICFIYERGWLITPFIFYLIFDFFVRVIDYYEEKFVLK